MSTPAAGLTPRKPVAQWEQLLLYLHGFCLDAPVIACVWSALYCLVLLLPIRWGDLGILSATIWIGYMFDRSLDLKRYPHQHELPFRHALIKRHQQEISLAGLIMLTVAIVLLVRDYEWKVLQNGMISLLLAGVYCAWVYFHPTIARKLIPRELAVAIFFTLATVIMPVSRSGYQAIDFDSMCFYLMLVACCWMNLCSISHWEFALDSTQGEMSIMQQVPDSKVLNLLNASFSFAIILLIMFLNQSMVSLGSCSLIIVLGTYLMNFIRMQAEVRSSVADIIMIIPVVLLLSG